MAGVAWSVSDLKSYLSRGGRVATSSQRDLPALLGSGGAREGVEKTRRSLSGKRLDLGDRYFRSSWEANYARYLNWMLSRKEILSWDYECQVFEFDGIKRGTRDYRPDFKVLLLAGGHEWHEVKGWMDPKSETRMKRMAKFWPGERVILIERAWFSANGPMLSGIIPGWEGGHAK